MPFGVVAAVLTVLLAIAIVLAHTGNSIKAHRLLGRWCKCCAPKEVSPALGVTASAPNSLLTDNDLRIMSMLDIDYGRDMMQLSNPDVPATKDAEPDKCNNDEDSELDEPKSGGGCFTDE
jgi:hypothetical protein